MLRRLVFSLIVSGVTEVFNLSLARRYTYRPRALLVSLCAFIHGVVCNFSKVSKVGCLEGGLSSDRLG